MATKGNNNNLYNYNPFTGIMPNNTNFSWMYYKYTLPISNQSIIHDISLDYNKLYLDSNNNTDIFILYAGGGSVGATGNETTPILNPSTDFTLLSSYFTNIGVTDSSIYTYKGYVNSGGGGGTGEVNITKIKYNDISDKKLIINIGSTTDTTIAYIQSSNGTTKTIKAYGNSNSVNGINAGNNAIYNKSDRLNNTNSISAFNSTTNTLFCGSASGYPGQQAIKYSQRSNVNDNTTYDEFIAFTTNGQSGSLAICNDFNTFNSTTNAPSSLQNISLTDINNGLNYLGAYDVTQAYVNFSNQDLQTDGTGTTAVLTGGNGSTYLKQTNQITGTLNGTTYTDYIDSFVKQDGQNGPPGFVMIFYKTIPFKKVFYTNMYQTNYNPLNNLFPKNNYNYFMYSKNTTTDIIHTIVNDNISNNSIIPDSNGNKVVNILYVANGGTGGTSKTYYGGGGGGGGGEVLLTSLTIDQITNNIITLNAGSSKGTSISYIPFNQTTPVTITAKVGINGTNAIDKNGINGANGTSLSTFVNINTSNSFNITTSYGSGTGGGGVGYSNGNSGIQGTTTSSYSVCDNISNKTSRYIKINDIGDGTGSVSVSKGGNGGSYYKYGDPGADGFVLIYYLVKGSM